MKHRQEVIDALFDEDTKSRTFKATGPAKDGLITLRSNDGHEITASLPGGGGDIEIQINIPLVSVRAGDRVEIDLVEDLPNETD